MTKSKRDFDPALLRAGVEARVANFKQRTTNHPSISAAHRRAIAALGCSTGPRVVMIAGPTGVGKTTLARAIWRHAMNRYAAEAAQDPGCVPVIGINAIPPNGASFNWKDFYIRLLQAHGEILIDRKLLIPRQSEIFPELPAPSPLERSVTDALRRSVENCLRLRKTKVLIIDEAHHLLMVNDPRRLEFQFEALKSLTIETEVIIVLVGTYRLLTIRDQSGQLVRRSEIIHFPRYDRRNQGDTAAFGKALSTFQAQLPLEKEPEFMSEAEYFYLKSAGCIGILKDWLTRCLEQAIRENSNTIDVAFADRFALSNKSLRTIIEESMNGEQELSDIGLDEIKKLLTDEATDMADATKSPKEAKSVSNRRRVGERRPVRDPIGGLRAP